jgi:hypothetical protein
MTMHKFELKEIKIPDTYDDVHSYKDKPGLSGVFGCFWYKNRVFYRENNRPAHVNFDGTMRWYTETKFVKVERTDYKFPSKETTWEDDNVKI